VFHRIARPHGPGDDRSLSAPLGDPRFHAMLTSTSAHYVPVMNHRHLANTRVRNVLKRVNPYASTAAFLGGMVWDAVTLVRIDQLSDNLILGAYLIALAAFMSLEHRVGQMKRPKGLLLKVRPYLAYPTQFFTGSLLIETVFSLDGLGLLGFESIVNRDYAVVFATLYIFGLIGLLVSLLSDITYTLVDPRIDFEAR